MCSPLPDAVEPEGNPKWNEDSDHFWDLVGEVNLTFPSEWLWDLPHFSVNVVASCVVLWRGES